MMLFFQTTHSQIITVAGTVTHSKEPLSEVNVMVKGTNILTKTGNDGRFSINAPNGDAVLVFSSETFETHEIAISDIRVFNALSLKSKNEHEEVVLVFSSVGFETRENRVNDNNVAPTSNRQTLTPKYMVDYPKFYAALSAGTSGFGTVWVGKADGNIFVMRVEAAYFFKEWLGAGLIYNTSRCDIEIKDVGVIGKEIVNFFGASVYGRYGLNLNRIILNASVGVGMLNWTFTRYLNYDYDYGIYTASIGGFISAGGNYMITHNLGVGLNLQSTLGSMKNSGFVRKPTALGCTIGVNYSF